MMVINDKGTHYRRNRLFEKTYSQRELGEENVWDAIYNDSYIKELRSRLRKCGYELNVLYTVKYGEGASFKRIEIAETDKNKYRNMDVLFNRDGDIEVSIAMRDKAEYIYNDLKNIMNAVEILNNIDWDKVPVVVR